MPKRKRHSDIYDRPLPKRGSIERALYDLNAKKSPFLRLPAEIRNSVYEYALGDKVIHISVRNCYDEPGSRSSREWDRYPPTLRHQSLLRITHVVCCLSTDVEDEAYEISQQPNHSDEGWVGSYPDRHVRCYETLADLKTAWRLLSDPGLRDLASTPRSKLPLALLASCRQIYNEAALIPYTTNVFAFHEAKTFDFFFSKIIVPTRLNEIVSIHADGWLDPHDCGHGAIRKRTIMSLKCLKSLRAWMRPAPWPPYLNENSQDAFQQLRLPIVKVICGTDSNEIYAREERAAKARQIEQCLRRGEAAIA